MVARRPTTQVQPHRGPCGASRTMVSTCGSVTGTTRMFMKRETPAHNIAMHTPKHQCSEILLQSDPYVWQEVFEDKVIDAYGQRDSKELRLASTELFHSLSGNENYSPY
eukprot:3677305-Amphidinium_carterae.2